MRVKMLHNARQNTKKTYQEPILNPLEDRITELDQSVSVKTIHAGENASKIKGLHGHLAQASTPSSGKLAR